MRATQLAPLVLLLTLPGCMTGPQERHYTVTLRNLSDKPVTVEVLDLDGNGSNKSRADLAPGGEYSGELHVYGPDYTEARVRFSDDPDKDRFSIFELPRGNIRRDVTVDDGKIVLKKAAPDPTR